LAGGPPPSRDSNGDEDAAASRGSLPELVVPMLSKLIRPVVLATVWLLPLLPLSAQAVGNEQSAGKRPQPKPKIEMAKWDPSNEDLIGLKEAQFAAMGLSKLTQAQYVELLVWAVNREDQVKKTALLGQLTYSCGPTRTKPEDYDHVRIYLDLPDGTPSELASPIRQGLRAIKDVEIVFSPKEADRTISFLAAQSKNEGGTFIGYVLSYIVTTPCVSKIADQTFDMNELDNHTFRLGGTNARDMAERVVADLDSSDVEVVRHLNSVLKKALQK
jgi:hypothetical protein